MLTKVCTLARMDKLSELVRQCRTKLGITLRAAAKSAEVSPAYLSRVENETLRPSASTLVRLAKVLKVDEDRLMAAAYRIPEDVQQVLLEDPAMVQVIRELKKRKHTGDSLLAWIAEWK